MKKEIKTTRILISMLICMSICGCKLESSSNGKLDGYWKLCTIDDLVSSTPEDLNSKSIFWSVEKDLLVVRDNDDSSRTEYVFRFHQSDTELTLSDSQIYKKSGNVALESIERLYKFGIYSQPITYSIDHLTSSRMTLSTAEVRLVFKKY